MLPSRFLCAGLVVAALAGSCGDGGGDSQDPKAAIYAAAIRWLVDREAEERPSGFEGTVYVEAADDERIPLEIQVRVVAELEAVAHVRFIDAREEAIDTSRPGDPVRGSGVLVGLGRLPSAVGARARLYAELYSDAADVVAYQLVVERDAGRWRVAAQPKRIRVQGRASASLD